MKVGFVGTKDGMSDVQREIVKNLLIEYIETTPISLNHFHYGDYMGADEEAYKIAVELKYETHCHGPSNDERRKNNFGIINYKETEWNFLKLVELSKVIIAAPKMTEEKNSKGGTWQALRCAKSFKKKIHIIYPDGKKEVLNEWKDSKKA